MYSIFWMKLNGVLYDVTQGTSIGDMNPRSVAARAQKHLEAISQRKRDSRSTFRILGPRPHHIGMATSDLIILAARPGMGKTSLYWVWLETLLFDHNMGVAIFPRDSKSAISHQADRT